MPHTIIAYLGTWRDHLEAWTYVSNADGCNQATLFRHRYIDGTTAKYPQFWPAHCIRVPQPDFHTYLFH